ncbi:restriction endonuclease subunit S [Lunatimonas salinarum]|uniref:restriction endonuclease subunit S n=1 Tax=Lunatimonas salinarum TaxID=1774590 RepID=UPI001AE0C917|nr:restriction endonuclease subunit S [Lunatimonas salinarum]
MTHLKNYKFADLYEMSSGISSKPEQAGHGAPFVSFKTVFNNYFLPDILHDMMDTGEEEQKVYSVKEGDIFLTRTSETLDELGMSSVAYKDYPSATFSGFLKRLRPIDDYTVYPKYIAFYLRSDLFRKTMNNNAIMTLRASLNEQIFSYLDLILPSFDQQKKIGDLLFSIYQRIELNKRINAELEAMAKLVYEYWFVQFDFPFDFAQGKPDVSLSGVEGSGPSAPLRGLSEGYKSSGGKMVWNEELKRDVPEGWRGGTISDIATLTRGVTYNKDDIQEEGAVRTVPILRATNITGNQIDLNNMVFVSESLADEEQILRPYDILITMSSGSIDHIGKNGFYFFDGKVAFGAFCAKIEAIEDFKFYLYSYTQSDFFFTTIKNECLGTNINNLNGSMVKGFKLVIPDNLTLEKFNQIVQPLYEKIKVNTKENLQLSKLRDWLLPMLMNGQVRVGEAEEMVEGQV